MLQVLFLSWILAEGVLAIDSPSTCPLSVSGMLCKTITKDGQTVQLVHKLVPVEVIERVNQPAYPNTTWKCVEPACLSSPCMYGGNCTEVDDGFECECPKGFGGQRCEIYPPRTCAELKARDGITEDGVYVIDPDGKHRNLSLPVEMECLMAEGITNVPHDITAQETTPNYMGVGEFVRNVTYPFDSNTILALIQNSRSCKQHIFATAYRSYIYSQDGSTQNVWWVSRQGRKMPNWGDTPSHHKGCACSYKTPAQPSNVCPASRLCYSDYSYSHATWYQDEGDLTDRDRLPVIRLHTGYTTETPYSTARYLYYNLGPLECEGYWS